MLHLNYEALFASGKSIQLQKIYIHYFLPGFEINFGHGLGIIFILAGVIFRNNKNIIQNFSTNKTNSKNEF